MRKDWWQEKEVQQFKDDFLNSNIDIAQKVAAKALSFEQALVQCFEMERDFVDRLLRHQGYKVKRGDPLRPAIFVHHWLKERQAWFAAVGDTVAQFKMFAQWFGWWSVLELVEEIANDLDGQ